MSQSLVSGSGSKVVQLQPGQFTPEQMKLITNVIAKGATPDELKLFLFRCEKLGLDPFKPGQIHFVKYGNNPGTIMVGIDGMRAIAARSRMVAGVNRGVVKDEQGRILYGWAEVRRKDWAEPAREEAPFAEYTTGKSSWASKPETMIKKVAEAAALRMAFPDDLGGVYEGAELDKLAEEPPTQTREQPGEGDGFQKEGYRVTGLLGVMGKHNGKLVQDIDPAVLRDIVVMLEQKSEKMEKPITAKWLEFIDHAEPLIAAWENSLGKPVEEEAMFDEEEPETAPAPGIIKR